MMLSRTVAAVSEAVDWWFIPHAAFFIALASTIEAIWKPSNKIHFTYYVSLSLGWELAEHFLQRTFTEQWSGVIEHWANAWLVDPLANGVGVLIGVAIARWSQRRSNNG